MTARSLIACVVVCCAACGSSAPSPATPVASTAPAEPRAAAEPVSPASPDTSALGAPAPGPDAASPPTVRPDGEVVKAQLLAAEKSAYERARPVLDKYCASCHTKSGKNASAAKLRHFDMSVYPFGGHHAGEMATTMRKVLAVGGGRPTMPRGKPGVVQGEELALIATWADAFEAARSAGAHEDVPGHGHHDAVHGHGH